MKGVRILTSLNDLESSPRREEFELSDPTLLAAAFETQPRTRKPNTRRFVPGPAERRAARRNCECGVCARCVENAKWNRIFTEKFADPDYYKPRPLRSGSSLGWLVTR